MWIRVCRYKNAGVAGYAEAFIPVQSDSHASEWYSYFENDVLVFSDELSAAAPFSQPAHFIHDNRMLAVRAFYCFASSSIMSLERATNLVIASGESGAFWSFARS